MRLSLTPEQRRILDEPWHTLFIEAAAGAGKTTTLALLALENLPKRITMLCFSASARQRLEDVLGLHGSARSRQIRVLTVTQLAKQITDELSKRGLIWQPQFLSRDEDARSYLLAAVNKTWKKYEDEIDTDFNFHFEHMSSRQEEVFQLLKRLKASLSSLSFFDPEFDDYSYEELASRFQAAREAIEICRQFPHQLSIHSDSLSRRTSTGYSDHEHESESIWRTGARRESH